jgi:hypothetical protein
MFGVKSGVIVPLAIGRSTCGSVKNCSVPMMAKTRMRTSAERTSGILMRMATCQALAPSIFAAS